MVTLSQRPERFYSRQVKNIAGLLKRVFLTVSICGCAMAAKPERTDLTASEALQLMSKGQLTSFEYVSAVLNRANHLKSLNAFISMQNADVLLTQAIVADVRRLFGFARPLEGLPIVIKDNYNTTFLKTTAGTPALFSNQPSTNAAAVQLLIDQGAIVIGKTNMHELAFGVTSNNAATGAVHNPYNASMIPGGSSGGTAAAIAARIVPFGLGTDTAGSIRIQASLSGTYGFHPRGGRYPTEGTVLISNTQDRVRTMARSVEDLLLLDQALATNPVQVQPISDPKLTRRTCRPGRC